MERSFIRKILEAIDDETISFAGGLPDESIFPIKELRKSANKIFKNKNNLQYSQTKGIDTLRNIIADFYNDEEFQTKKENILITAGSQQALYIIGKYFTSKDILIEDPSYLGAINIFKTHHLAMQPVTLKSDGIDIKQFKKLYKNSKLAYLIPDFQNPKGSLYSQEKRVQIAKYVKNHGGYIIEDAPYSELYFEKKSKSISERIPNNSFHLGSFSKTLSPAFRIGWIRAEEKLIEQLSIIKEAIDLHSCSISQYILTQYLQDKKRYTNHLKNIRKKYQNKMDYFCKTLKKEIPNITIEKPKGGMFLYVTLDGYDTQNLIDKAIEKKVLFVPGSEFHIDKKTSDTIRFNFTHSSKKEIKKGIKRLKSILENKL